MSWLMTHTILSMCVWVRVRVREWVCISEKAIDKHTCKQMCVCVCMRLSVPAHTYTNTYVLTHFVWIWCDLWCLPNYYDLHPWCDCAMVQPKLYAQRTCNWIKKNYEFSMLNISRYICCLCVFTHSDLPFSNNVMEIYLHNLWVFVSH